MSDCQESKPGPTVPGTSASANPTPSHQAAKEDPAASAAPHAVEIEIVRHRVLVELLRDPRSLWRLLLTMFLLLVVLFLGLSVVVFSIKKFYPYNAIETNLYGATTFEGENKDVTYWLFNTAELWANSGIEVRRGDVLTIRTSGAWHTAIHHLVTAADKNEVLPDSWVGSDGEDRNRSDKRWNYRARYRLSETNPDGVLLMEIIPHDSAKIMTNLSAEGRNQPFVKYVEDHASGSPSRYVIAKERINLLVKSDGLLHFAVNDIVLTRPKIKQMYLDFVNKLAQDTTLLDRVSADSFRAWVGNWEEDKVTSPTDFLKGKDLPTFDEIEGRDYIYGRNVDSTKISQFGVNCCLNNELIYYYNENFLDAWYVDNVGSFLVVVERKRSNKDSGQ